MPKSNFRALSFFILCLSSFYFCQGQDSLRTLKSERHFYKGKVFKAVYYNEKGQRILDWENDVGVYRHASNHLTFNSYDDPNIDRLSTRYYVKVKAEKTVKFLKESGKPDGIISATKTDSIIDRKYTERYIFQTTKNRRKHSIKELPKLDFVAILDKILHDECKGVLIDSTAILKEYRAKTQENKYHFYGAIYDSLGNYLKSYNKYYFSDDIYLIETETIGQTEIVTFKTYRSSLGENELVSGQEDIYIYNEKKQRIKEEFYLTNIKTGNNKLVQAIEHEYFSDKIEKQTITRGRKKYVVEISRAYW